LAQDANPIVLHPTRHLAHEMVALRLLTAAAALAPAAALQVREEACECLTYREAFNEKTHMFSCKHLGEDMCSTVYNLQENYCINSKDETSGIQQCYVDGSCQHLNGGARINDKVSTKICDPSKGDRLMSSLSLEQLFGLARQFELDVGMMLKLAYPKSKGEKWTDAKKFWWRTEYGWGVLGKRKAAKSARDLEELGYGALTSAEANMLQVAESQARVFFPSESGEPPYGVVQGHRAYEIKTNYTYAQEQIMKGNRLQAHPGLYHTVHCLIGCEDKDDAIAVKSATA